MSPVDRGEKHELASDKRKHRIELAAAIIIGIAAVLTAIATFQESRVDGTVQSKSTEAVDLTLQSNDWYNESTAEQAKERDWFFGYLTAAINEEDDVADVLFRAMPGDVQQLTDEWLTVYDLFDPDQRLDDPFFIDENGLPLLPSFSDLHSTQLFDLGNERAFLSECALFEAQVAELRGENYGLSTVFLAIALVVGGIAALLKGKAAQTIVLVTSVLSLLMGASVLALAQDQVDARQEAAVELFTEEDGERLAKADALAVVDESCP